MEYDSFSVDSPALKYALHVSATYNGDAGDVIDGGGSPTGDLNGMMFSDNTILMVMMMTINQSFNQ